MLCSVFRSKIQSWIRDYDLIQSFAVIFIYVQVGCALVGSLGAFYNGVLLINLAISLFALVAVESSSQRLARTYAVLLFTAIMIDVVWFIFFSHEIWNISSDAYGTYVIFSVKLTLWMQIIGFCMRLLSSLLWVQMYRLGVSYIDGPSLQETDSGLRTSFLSPVTPAIARANPEFDEALGGTIYDPKYYSSLFEDGQDNGYLYGGQNHEIGESGSTSKAQVPELVLDENALIKSTSI